MNSWGLILVIGSLLFAAAAFIWVALSLNKKPAKKSNDDLGAAAEADVEHIFNDDFREELRNRGRLHFEKIIGENAMFLQQDLRLTTSQLNEYMKGEITRTLQEEFAKYEQSIDDAKGLALESIKKTQAAIEEQRQLMGQQLQTQLQAEKETIMKRFEDNMTDIINHYVVDAVGSQIDLTDQLEYILGELEKNKPAIVEDMRSGA
jgi:vacuolar-type H+-ATPase subunit H